jgi:3-oxoacyl-[acyl-carrier-protein] synthase II
VFKVKVVITDYELITGYGLGIAHLWNGLKNKKTCIRSLRRFSVKSFQSKNAACVNGLTYLKNKSLVLQMLEKVFAKNNNIPPDAFLILATTIGEIDILENVVLRNKRVTKDCVLTSLLNKVQRLVKIKEPGIVVSCACASSSAAIGFASSLIYSGKHDCVLVVAADAVTEFVFSGFSSLMALDPDKAKPFDKNRAGLSLGEGAGFILLMSEKRAKKESRKILGEVAGWAVAGDANHMTGPVRDGSGLCLAIQKAMKKADISSDDVGCISSHGTGTAYNDSMEMKAYNRIFNGSPVPLYSVKGAVGHTMGAAGLIETIIALRVLQERIIPTTVGLKDVDHEAKDWVSLEKRNLDGNAILVNNSGFGGINASLVLKQ